MGYRNRLLAGAAALLLGLAALPAQAQQRQQQQARPQVSRGEYLATIMDCGGCHTPGALAGQPDQKARLSGSDIGFGIPGLGYFYPPNLTPDVKTGLGSWSEQDIIRAVRKGERPDGRMLAPVMPWPSYAMLTDEDARALARFLKSLPPVSHAVPSVTGAAEPAPAAYLGVVRPGQ